MTPASYAGCRLPPVVLPTARKSDMAEYGAPTSIAVTTLERAC